MMRARLIAALFAISVTASCGALIDTTYLLGNGKTSSVVPASAGTGQAETRLEYEVHPGANQGIDLLCYQRTRAVERGWSVTKTYEYRGGYEKSTYTGTAVLDGVLGATIGGVLTGMCLNDESDVSCAHIAWASPFAIDLVYSLVRRATVRPKVLVNKSQSSDRMQFGAATQEVRTECQSVAGLFLGISTGPSDEQRLNGYVAGERDLGEGALQLGFDAAGQIVLDEQAINVWAGQRSASLWVRDDQAQYRPVTVDRCTLLRPHSLTMAPEARATFQADCPLPQPQR